MNMDAGVVGGGPAPFLLKTYEMVDDTTTDGIVSWSSTRKSFVVWNPPEFARLLLPTYFKHNNFSSFIRQLNTYGFRKIDPERWEFANEDFIKDQKHLLKNIHRRKPIHSHSQPQGSTDPERSAFEEEIDKLSREKSDLEQNLSEFKDQNSTAKEKSENLTSRIANLEQRQERLLIFLDKAVQNPEFVERLAQKLESMDFSAYNKKRRLPQVDQSQSIQGMVVNQSDKLHLELSPAVSDTNLLSHSTQSSNEDGTMSPQASTRALSKDGQARTEHFRCSDTLELSDTCGSITLKMDSSISHKETQKTPHALASSSEGEGRISCLLNLTLASSTPLEVNKSPDLTHLPQDIGKETSTIAKNDDVVQSLRGNNKETAQVAPNRVNDLFWEQFLTERPGCTDAEKASSSFSVNPYDKQEDKRSSKGVSRNTKGMEHLTL